MTDLATLMMWAVSGVSCVDLQGIAALNAPLGT